MTSGDGDIIVEEIRIGLKTKCEKVVGIMVMLLGETC
jgi:hypothetical protein